MKLKAVLAVTAALSFGGAFAQANFSDVPAGHWAKDAVDKMAAQGCIIGFPDGTFRGNESLTRYQAALILARCLQQGAVTGGTDTETLESIKNAIQELSSELAALGVRVADVEDNAATKDDVAALEERVAALEGDKDVIVDGGSTEGLQELQDAIDALQEAQDAQIADLTATLDDLVAQLDELAGAQEDLASRVEALENAEPATGEDLSGALDDLAGQIDDLTAGQDELTAGLEDLTATVDELTAGLDDLNARVDELSAANEETAAVLDEINSRIEELAGAIDDVNVRVDDLEGTVGDVSTTVDGLGEQVESNAASIVALQDLTVLLNEDIVGLEDRISALESDKADAADVDARFTNLNRDLTDLTNRVTVVETNLSDLQGKFNTLNGTFGFSVSGTLSSTYYVSRVTGSDFDIDRLIPGTKFSTGVDGDGDDTTKDRAYDWTDFEGGSNRGKVTGNGFTSPVFDGDVTGDTKTSLSLSLDFANRGLEGKSAYAGAQASDTQAFNVHKVIAEFGIDDLDAGDIEADPDAGDDDKGRIPLRFYIKGITTQFDIAGNPIKFTIGENLKTKFTENVFDADDAGFGDGYLAQVDGSSLPGLGAFSPKLVVAYGHKSALLSDEKAGDNPATPGVEENGYSVPVVENDAYVRGVRATISPVTDVTLGVSAAQIGSDVQSPDVSFEHTVFGADLNAKIAGWTISSEYAQEKYTDTVLDDPAFTDEDSLFFVKVGGAVGPVTLNANYHAVSDDFNGLQFDANDKHSQTFADNSRGFAVDASVALGGFGVKGYFAQEALFTDATVNLTQYGASVDGQVSIIKLGAYFDGLQGSKFTVDPDGNGPLVDTNGNGIPDTVSEKGVSDTAVNNATRFGVTAGVNLAGFDIKGYYQNVMVDGVTVAGVPKLHPDNATPFSAKGAWAEGDQTTKAGVDLSGAVAGLNVKAGFMIDSGTPYITAPSSWVASDFDRTTIYADVDTSLTAGILTLKPEAHYKSVQDADAGTDDTTMFSVGLSAKTATLATFLAPSFNANIGYYQNQHTDKSNFTSSVLNYSLGVKSDAFLFDKSTLAVTWAGWQGKNRKYIPFSGTTAGYFEDAAVGDITLGGIYAEWNYWDLNFAYGDFTLNEAGAVSNGQAFKISYKVKF
ncbi:S-layer homology domain-containing protein [Deinococcus cellulosilyticus]|uniref:SLH domain-containing protein n=1 Tax=Deinococcus cellulosilyticus (strain DSM 18568 / NBRC 106333 / KACC 11606 / 5516J-15) TaxID=1223518 RepID=A0A511NBL8_DEIC1|nr:S-layer homology domain-containing protein [Deinococcus cellulosilyticus]GEM49966.1 hypothetical protein DC3_56010 [Deinococcus cellulosilyticus NBRC 106333 = KACC 11606]